MERIVTEFLNCNDEHHREALANLIINYSLMPHAKGAEIAPLLGIMNMFELFEQYNYKKNRKHMVDSKDAIVAVEKEGLSEHMDCICADSVSGRKLKKWDLKNSNREE